MQVEPLQGWMLPHLQDAAVLDLQPLLQKALLLQTPERLLSTLVRRPPLAPEVLVAHSGGDRLLGLSVVRRLNRSGSCWGVEELRLCREALSEPGSPTARQVEGALLREALHRCPGASSWITRVPTGHQDRLALLREQGFQPLLQETLWYWEPDPANAGTSQPAAAPPGDDLQLRPLNRRSAPLLWHLEQATCPAQLRQLLDRRIEDVLDQSEGQGLLWVDPSRQQAVAAVRRLRSHRLGPAELEVTLHPGWAHLHGPALARLVRQQARGFSPLRLRSDTDDHERERWLSLLGAVAEGEELLMARSVWRRQDSRVLSRQSWRLDTVLDPFKPRRRPVPTPLQRGVGGHHGPQSLGCPQSLGSDR
ncbi:hypothetical protein KBZ18_02845 [Synechococcus sp. Cruz-9H2]|uniref:hypothetical protein n=2 Tax=Synechococcus TaxID=1129 RepID=UPI0020CB9F52|nr:MULTISPECIES: hypothetical protein [unclassified Synechococcus]MCP9855322.1 hypothetical protein [Synechococcus sp. Cruz-9C9]MCP9818429.1 hypothetical protein [Synechococcus sp. Cruz-9H2]MCP9842658.1 hypothetical protein [Synechococcus sp. Edmonson 11F2]MCP9862430.1 hypothetical protein [Synechococcus sp. Cruz-7E5]MCP9869702.1 hypothetical protein [Synechococcus sp. Cruz-7B9]